MIHNLALKSRSYRTFDESIPITEDVLLSLIDTARCCPSARNLQPLKYRIVTERDEVMAMVSMTKWATSLRDTKLPPEGMQPSAFIIICHDTNVSDQTPISMIDVGIVAQTIMLEACEMGFGGCMLASFKPNDVSNALLIPQRYIPTLALALGTPTDETILICKVDENMGTLYYRSSGNLHFVPKRELEEIIIK